MISALISLKLEEVLEWFQYFLIVYNPKCGLFLWMFHMHLKSICIKQCLMCILKMTVMSSHLRLFANLPYSHWFLVDLVITSITKRGVLKASNKLRDYKLGWDKLKNEIGVTWTSQQFANYAWMAEVGLCSFLCVAVAGFTAYVMCNTVRQSIQQFS